MKKFFILLVAMVTVIGIYTGNLFGNEPKRKGVYTSNEFMNVGELDNNPTAESKGDTEKLKAEFAYEMAQITTKIVSASTTNVEHFKSEFAYATAQVTAKVMPIIPSGQKNDFAYEMARITTKIVSDQNLDIEKAKTDFAYEIAQITTKIITNADKIVTGNGTMLKVYNDCIEPKATVKVSNTSTDQKATRLRKNSDIEPKSAVKVDNTSTDQKAMLLRNNADIEPRSAVKVDNTSTDQKAMLLKKNADIEPKLAVKVDNTSTDQKAMLLKKNADIEPKSAIKVDNTVTDPKAKLLMNNADIDPKSAIKVDNTGTGQKATLLRKNSDIEPKSVVKVDNTDTVPKKIVNPGDIAPETYKGLIDELMHVGDRSNHLDNKVKIDGEIRYHYAFNSGSGGWDKDSSGIRTYLGADTGINRDWRAYAMLESQKSLVNYNNEFRLSRLYVAGKVGTTMVRAGSFGYLMAEGNIYDSGFKGVRADFGESVKYTLSHGKTDYTKETSIATARYDDFDYNLEAGVYHYQMDDTIDNQNTIWTLGGNYNFSNFGVGAMVLGSSLKDSKGNSKGYVFSLNYGDLKAYRPGTYMVFTKYYNQPKDTYIAHGMNAIGGLMKGFKGYGSGVSYTIAKDFVAGIEHYNLTGKTSGEKSKTWWSQLTYYF